MATTDREVIDGLTTLIRQSLGVVQRVSWDPSQNADRDDATVAFHKGRAEKLRHIRQSVEDLLAESDAAGQC